MKTKTLVVTSILTAILVPFIATNATIYASDNDNEIDNNENALTLQIYINGNSKIDRAWTQIINDFRDETDIEIKTYKGTQVNTQLKSKWDEDNPPDFVWVDGNGINDVSLIEDGKFEDLSSWYQTAEVFGSDDYTLVKDVINNDLVYQYEGGKMYEMPLLGLIHGAYYDDAYLKNNEYLFEEDDPSNPGEKIYRYPSNYEELKIFSDKVKQDNKAPLTYPGQYPSYLLWSYIMPCYAAGGDIDFFNKICDARDTTVFNDPRFKEVLVRFKEYADNGNILNDSVNQNHTQAQRAWLDHRAMAISNGMWLEGEVQDMLDENPDFKMHFTTSPLIDEGEKSVSLVIPRNVAIASKAKHKDNAYKFLSFLYKEESQKRLCEAYSYFSVLEDIDYSTYNLTDCTRQTFEEFDKSDIKVYKKYDWGTVGDIFNNVINALVSNEYSVDVGIGKIIDEAKKLK